MIKNKEYYDKIANLDSCNTVMKQISEIQMVQPIILEWDEKDNCYFSVIGDTRVMAEYEIIDDKSNIINESYPVFFKLELIYFPNSDTDFIGIMTFGQRDDNGKWYDINLYNYDIAFINGEWLHYPLDICDNKEFIYKINDKLKQDTEKYTHDIIF